MTSVGTEHVATIMEHDIDPTFSFSLASLWEDKRI